MILVVEYITSLQEGSNGGQYRRMDFKGLNEFGEPKKYYTYIDADNKNYKNNWDVVEQLVDQLPLAKIVVSIPNFKLKNKKKGMINADCRVSIHREYTEEFNHHLLRKAL